MVFYYKVCVQQWAALIKLWLRIVISWQHNGKRVDHTTKIIVDKEKNNWQISGLPKTLLVAAFIHDNTLYQFYINILQNTSNTKTQPSKEAAMVLEIVILSACESKYRSCSVVTKPTLIIWGQNCIHLGQRKYKQQNRETAGAQSRCLLRPMPLGPSTYNCPWLIAFIQNIMQLMRQQNLKCFIYMHWRLQTRKVPYINKVSQYSRKLWRMECLSGLNSMNSP